MTVTVRQQLKVELDIGEKYIFSGAVFGVFQKLCENLAENFKSLDFFNRFFLTLFNSEIGVWDVLKIQSLR